MTAIPPNDEEFVRQLLDESGVGTSLPLQTALLDLRSAASAAPPAPAGALAAFMAPAVVPLRPRRKAARGAMIGLAIAAATGLGVSGVAAANPGFHSAVGQAVGHVIEVFHPAGDGASTSQAPAPGQAPAGTPGSGAGNQARPVPAETGTSGPDADRPSPDPADAATAPATGSPEPTDPSGQQGTTAPGHRRNTLPAPDLPVPSGLPNQARRPGGAGLPVPAVPHRTVPAVPHGTEPALPDLPDLPALPGRDPGR